MSRSELTTAAANILVINRPAAQDVMVLQERWLLHPLDAEAVFFVPKTSSCQADQHYIRLSLLWPEVIKNRVRMVDATFFIRDGALAIISHEVSPTLQPKLETWSAAGGSTQSSATELLVELLLSIAYQQSTLPISTNRANRQSLADAIGALPAALSARGPLTDALSVRFRFLLHLVKYPLESPVVTSRPADPAISAEPVISELGPVVRGYALLSAAVIVLVIIVTSR